MFVVGCFDWRDLPAAAAVTAAPACSSRSCMGSCSFMAFVSGLLGNTRGGTGWGGGNGLLSPLPPQFPAKSERDWYDLKDGWDHTTASPLVLPLIARTTGLRAF